MSEVDRVAIRARLNATIGMMPRTDLEALLDLADDLEKEVQRLRERPSVETLAQTMQGDDVLEGRYQARWGEYPDTDAWYLSNARSVLALFPTVEGGDTRD